MAAASSSSLPLPPWLRPCVEKQPALDIDLNVDLNEEEEEKRRKKKKKQAAVAADPFSRLPDGVVMVIVDKLFHLKTLLRFSLTAKRYYALASRTHSLVADLSVPSCPDGAAAAAAVARSGKQKVCAIIHRFQHIKRLHLYLPKPPLSSNGNANGVFSRWVAVFGSKFEQFLFISAASINPPVPGMNTVAVEEPWFDLFRNIVTIARQKHEIAKKLLLSQCEMVETAMFFDPYQGGALLMGKPQIAKLRANHRLDHPPPPPPPPLPPLPLLPSIHQILLSPLPAMPQLRLAGYHLRALDLPKTGYSLKGVNVVSVIYDDQDQRPIVEVMGGCEEMMNAGDEWDVFTEVAALVSNDRVDKETMYDFLFP